MRVLRKINEASGSVFAPLQQAVSKLDPVNAKIAALEKEKTAILNKGAQQFNDFLVGLGFTGRRFQQAWRDPGIYEMKMRPEDFKADITLFVVVPVFPLDDGSAVFFNGYRLDTIDLRVRLPGDSSVTLFTTGDQKEFSSFVRSCKINFWRALKKLPESSQSEFFKAAASIIDRKVKGVSSDDRLSTAEFLAKYKIPDVTMTYVNGKRSTVFDRDVLKLSSNIGAIRNIRRLIAEHGAPSSVEKFDAGYKDDVAIAYAARMETEWHYSEGNGVRLKWADGTKEEFVP